MIAKLGREHCDGATAQFSCLFASESLEGPLCNRQQFRDVVGRLRETAVAYLVVDVAARVEQLDALGPLGEVLVPIVEGRSDLLDELAPLWVIGRIDVTRENLLQATL